MYLESDFATESENATRDDVIGLIRALGHEHSIARLARADEIYIQTVYLPAAALYYIPGEPEFGIDFRDGGPSLHYAASNTDRESVLEVFLGYLDQDDRWRTALDWTRDTRYEEISD